MTIRFGIFASLLLAGNLIEGNCFISVRSFIAVCPLLLCTLLVGRLDAGDQNWPRVKELLTTHCLDCHDGPNADAGLDLANPRVDFELQTVADQWQLVLEKLVFKVMPPEDASQPLPLEERRLVVRWIEERLKVHGHKSSVAEKMRAPEYGNYFDHDSLFDRANIRPGFSPARLWRKSPYIFDVGKYRVFGNSRQLTGQVDRFVKQPFAIEDKQGIKDFSAILLADSATLETLLRNASFVVDKQLEGAVHELDVRRNGPPDPASIPRDKRGRPKPKRYHKTIEEFANIVLHEGDPEDELLRTAINKQIELVLQRPASARESEKYLGLAKNCIKQAGNAEGLRTTLMAILVSPEAVYRMELGQAEADAYGRRLLSPVELAFAISYALTDSSPDEQLLQAAREGRLATAADVRREASRIWDDAAIEKPRVLRFFREFFGYHHASKVFKDDKRIFNGYTRGKFAELLVRDADTLVRYVVENDRHVLRELLTSQRYFVAHSGDNALEAVQVDALQKFYAYFKDKNYKKFAYQLEPSIKQHVRSLGRRFTHSNGNTVRNWMKYLEPSVGNGLTPLTIERNREYILSYNLHPRSFSFPIEQPFALSQGKRAGLLMHPSWLIAFSLNLDNDPVRRGKWIRERLLAGAVPELPITVDARIPEDAHKSLRERFAVVRKEECWKCHIKMNPLGMPFEMFDDFGRLRDREQLHAKGESKAVDASGRLDSTGDPSLDGEVSNAVDLVNRLAKSRRVQQSFVRHAFRYWMARNETLDDAGTLIGAEQAYIENQGSFRALVISLLASDAFRYRKFDASTATLPETVAHTIDQKGPQEAQPSVLNERPTKKSKSNPEIINK